ncbi:ABC transporter ATP-binding protein [Salinigranum salinum]|uniref:ABC transporter ATP-binding protein n=1 Tax=Salinigranum salinum TaxID=1364937 RepID=UPI0012608223|nr:ABC transporter ATP-binding protein [Salinigranum salinum]
MSDTTQSSKAADTSDVQTDAAQSDEEINVRIDDLSKVYDDDEGGVLAVDDLSIDIRRGEFLVLVGPSGCGKTTTLRTVAGLETPTEGRIWIEDEDVSGLEPRERGVAMVFQNYALYPHMTVRENLSFPLRIRNYPSDEIDERVEHTADLLEISELLDRKPSALSGGQQQRVALGRAIVREPSVFLMDEPLSNLDAKLRVQMRTELNEIHKRVEKTTIYVTHDQAEAMTLGDRVAVLNQGRLQQLGPPQQLYDEPVNRFVAGFIGEPPMNFLPADIVPLDDGGYRAQTDEFQIELTDDLAATVDRWGGDPASLTLGIRPEDINDAALAGDAATPANTIEAYVRVIEPMGSDKYLTLSPTAAGEYEFTARVSPASEVREDEFAELRIDRSKMHLFDDETGQNITV